MAKKLEYTVLMFGIVLALGVYGYGNTQNNPSFKLLAFAIIFLMGIFTFNGTGFQNTNYSISNSADGLTSTVTTTYANVKNAFTDGIALVLFAVGIIGGFIESMKFYNLFSNVRSTRSYGGA